MTQFYISSFIVQLPFNVYIISPCLVLLCVGLPKLILGFYTSLKNIRYVYMAKIIISHCLFLSGRIINILIITIFGVARGQSGYDNLNLLLRKIRSIIFPTPYQLVLPTCYFVFLLYFGFKQKTNSSLALCLTSKWQIFTIWPLYIHDKYFYIYSCSFCLPFVLAFIAEIFFGLQGMSSGIYWDLIVSYNSSFHGHSPGMFSNVAYCVGEDPNLNIPLAPAEAINLDQVVDNPGSEKKRGLSEGEDTAEHPPRKRLRLSPNADAGNTGNLENSQIFDGYPTDILAQDIRRYR